MIDVFKDVEAFHIACDVFSSPVPEIVISEKALRSRLVNEECLETIEAIEANDIVEIIDGTCDLTYVLAGTALVFKLISEEDRAQINKAFSYVHDGPVAKIEVGDAAVEEMRQHNKALVEFLARDSFTLSDLDDFESLLIAYMWATARFADEANIPFSDAWGFVQSANMAKVDPVTGKVFRDAGNKVQKPPGWISPNAKIEELVRKLNVVSDAA